MEQPIQEQQSTDLFNEEIRYTPASQGQRFLNWLIDNILIRLIITQLTVKLMINFLLDVAPAFTYKTFAGDPTFNTYLVSYLFSIVHYLFYYTICEKAFRGYTLGKLITGTRAVRTDGSELNMRDAMLRSLSRMVPFEAFSGLGRAPWHDTWTKTTVIKSR